MAVPVQKLELEAASTEAPGAGDEPMETADAGHLLHRLASGRQITLRQEGTREDLEVRSAQGELEVLISLTDAGPVIRLKGARLELESTEEISMKCRRLEVKAEESIKLHSRGDAELAGRQVGVVAAGDLDLQGNRVFLN